MHQEIIDYIGQAQKHGLTDFEIKQNLLSAGWEATAVEESFVFAKAAESRPQAFGAMETTAKSPEHASPGSQMVTKPAIQATATVNPNTNIAISEKHFAPGNTSGIKKSTIIILAVLLILSLGGVAFGYYQYIHTTPEKVMAKFFAGYASSKTETVKTNVTLSYSDKNASENGSAPQEFTVGLATDGYFDSRDANNTKADANVKFSFKSAGTEGSMQLQYMNFAKVYFINLANIPQLKGMFGDKEVSWIKFDLAELEKYAKEQSPTNASSSDALLNNPELKKKLNDIWVNAKILTPGTVLAKETLNGTAVFRLEPQIDYTKLDQAVMNSIDVIQSYQPDSSKKMTDQQKSITLSIIKKFQIKELKLWIGQKDYRLYKTKITLASPGVNDFSKSSVFLPSVASEKIKSRDALRLASARQMASALESNAVGLGGYPEGKDGKPAGVDPKYLINFPTAPLPSDGACTDYFNTYWYTPTGKPVKINESIVYPNFEISFCLGESTGGFAPGVAKITADGIKAGIECPLTDVNCQKQTPDLDSKAMDELNTMSFNAETTLEATFKDYGMVKDIKEPENSLDLIELIKGFFTSSSTQSSLN